MYFPVLLQYLYQKKPRLQMILQEIRWIQAVLKLRKQFPKFKPADIDLLCYIYAGFSAQIISVITGDSVSNIYNRKSRLKARIAASDSSEKDFFIQKM